LDADRPWLEVERVTKVYGGVVALADASLALRAGEIRGLVGANGAGKSTLVKVLTGLVSPTSGGVAVDGAVLAPGRPQEALRAGIAAVPQELIVARTLTVAENVMLGHEPRGVLGRLQGKELRRAAGRVLDALDVRLPADEPVGRLPLIEQRLVMIARALSRDARLVIFDEPTATVSPREVELLIRAVRTLSERGVSVLYVSHRLDEIETLCDSVTVLRDGCVVLELAGGGSRAVLVEALAAGSGRTAERGGGPARPILLDVRDLHSERLHDVSLTARGGEIVGLAGLAGSGARELLLAICGAVPFERGTISVAGRRLRSGRSTAAVAAGVAYLPGDRSLSAFPSHSVRHNVSLGALRRHSRLAVVRRSSERSAVAELLDRVALRADPEASISSLSGGNQQRAILARWIGAGARVLLLDDPTAGVDVATRPALHHQVAQLRDGGAAVLLVSTDVVELVDLCDRVLTFDRGTVMGELAAAELTPARVLEAMTKGAR
jgi:ABC-type sugar transport system ATPase subunit